MSRRIESPARSAGRVPRSAGARARQSAGRALACVCLAALFARRADATATGAPGAAPTPAASPGFFGQMPFNSSKEPITIDASQLEFDYQKNRVTYRGKVHAVQGDLVIDSDTLIVTLDRADGQKEAKLREVIAQGNVVITQGTRTATGVTATFSQLDRKIVLTGDPVLHDGPNEVTGDRIVVLLDEGRSIVESSQKKRVSATLYPGSQEGGVVAADGKPKAGAVAADGKPKAGGRTP